MSGHHDTPGVGRSPGCPSWEKHKAQERYRDTTPAPDFSAITTGELRAYRDAENRFRGSSTARTVLGEPDTGAAIGWRETALPGRDYRSGDYRSAPTADADAAPRKDTSGATGLPQPSRPYRVAPTRATTTAPWRTTQCSESAS
ncbi:hypothetical protein ABZY93_09925 [Streptomyces smyrnaeus]|uniref:hypothetical protein n=1 Tax=Streptomyces smyrnaeus TaxID=1387713 RepID=UPI00339FBECA